MRQLFLIIALLCWFSTPVMAQSTVLQLGALAGTGRVVNYDSPGNLDPTFGGTLRFGARSKGYGPGLMLTVQVDAMSIAHDSRRTTLTDLAPFLALEVPIDLGYVYVGGFGGFARSTLPGLSGHGFTYGGAFGIASRETNFFLEARYQIHVLPILGLNRDAAKYEQVLGVLGLSF